VAGFWNLVYNNLIYREFRPVQFGNIKKSKRVMYYFHDNGLTGSIPLSFEKSGNIGTIWYVWRDNEGVRG